MKRTEVDSEPVIMSETSCNWLIAGGSGQHGGPVSCPLMPSVNCHQMRSNRNNMWTINMHIIELASMVENERNGGRLEIACWNEVNGSTSQSACCFLSAPGVSTFDGLSITHIFDRICHFHGFHNPLLVISIRESCQWEIIVRLRWKCWNCVKYFHYSFSSILCFCRLSLCAPSTVMSWC